MTNMIPIDPAQNIYAFHPHYDLIGKERVLFEGRAVHKLTYSETHCLLWKIGQVVLAALSTLASLGITLCFQKGRALWTDAFARFPDQIVLQNIITPIPKTAKPVSVIPPALTTAPTNLISGDMFANDAVSVVGMREL